MPKTFHLTVPFRNDNFEAEATEVNGVYSVTTVDKTVNNLIRDIVFSPITDGIGLRWDDPGYELAASFARAVGVALTTLLITEGEFN